MRIPPNHIEGHKGGLDFVEEEGGGHFEGKGDEGIRCEVEGCCVASY